MPPPSSGQKSKQLVKRKAQIQEIQDSNWLALQVKQSRC